MWNGNICRDFESNINRHSEKLQALKFSNAAAIFIQKLSSKFEMVNTRLRIYYKAKICRLEQEIEGAWMYSISLLCVQHWLTILLLLGKICIHTDSRWKTHKLGNGFYYLMWISTNASLCFRTTTSTKAHKSSESNTCYLPQFVWRTRFFIWLLQIKYCNFFCKLALHYAFITEQTRMD